MLDLRRSLLFALTLGRRRQACMVVVAHGVTERTHGDRHRGWRSAPNRVTCCRLVVGQGRCRWRSPAWSSGVAGAWRCRDTVQGLLFGVTADRSDHVRSGRGDAARRRARRLLHPGVARHTPESNDGAAGGSSMNTIMADGWG